MRIRSLVLVTGLLLAASASVLSQPEVGVGDMDRPLTKWGIQTIGLPLMNKVDYPKYVVVIANLSFEGTYLNPMRGWRGNYILEPGQSTVAAVRLEIPPNYGIAHVKFEVYDVVDTMDALLASQKIMDQSMQIRFTIPEGVTKYMQDRLTMTPMVDHNPYMGTEFARVLVLMMKEGKTIPEIAKLAELDTSYVRQFQDTLLAWQFFGRTKTADSAVTPAFPILSAKDADMARPLVEKTSADLATMIEKNLPAYKLVLDSMVKAGGLARDSNDFINGGTVLYRRYPVITALFLWYDMGQAFVGGTSALDVYRDTDPCNAWVTRYLYAVEGGDLVNGNQYYNYSTATGRAVILFGDQIPVIHCPDAYPWKPRLLLVTDYNYEPEYQPELFVFDTTLVNPALRALSKGSEPILKAAMAGLRTEVDKMGPNLLTQGTALWFWNQVATRTTRKLVDKGLIARLNNGQYRFESMSGSEFK